MRSIYGTCDEEEKGFSRFRANVTSVYHMLQTPTKGALRGRNLCLQNKVYGYASSQIFFLESEEGGEKGTKGWERESWWELGIEDRKLKKSSYTRDREQAKHKPSMYSVFCYPLPSPLNFSFPLLQHPSSPKSLIKKSITPQIPRIAKPLSSLFSKSNHLERRTSS